MSSAPTDDGVQSLEYVAQPTLATSVRTGREDQPMKRLAVATIAAVGLLAATAVPAERHHLRRARRGRAPLRRVHDLLRPGEPGLVQLQRHAARRGHVPDRRALHVRRRDRGRAVPPRRRAGGTDVWVTFEETEVLAGWPARADFPDRGGALRRPQRVARTTTPTTPRARRSRTRTTTTSPASRSTTTSGSSSSTRPSRWRRTAGWRRSAPPRRLAGANGRRPQQRPRRDRRLRHPGDPAEADGRRVALQVDLAHRRGQRQQSPRAATCTRSTTRARSAAAAAPASVTPAGRCSSTTRTRSRRGVVRLQRHLPRRRLLVAGRHREQLRLRPAVPLGQSLDADRAHAVECQRARPGDLARQSAGRTSWSTCRSPRTSLIRLMATRRTVAGRDDRVHAHPCRRAGGPDPRHGRPSLGVDRRRST